MLLPFPPPKSLLTEFVPDGFTPSLKSKRFRDDDLTGLNAERIILLEAELTFLVTEIGGGFLSDKSSGLNLDF